MRENYSAMKRNEALAHATAGADPGNAALSWEPHRAREAAAPGLT